ETYFNQTQKATDIVISTHDNLELAKEEAALLRQNVPVTPVINEISKVYESDLRLAELNDKLEQERLLADAANYVDGIMRAAELNAQKSEQAALQGNLAA